MWALFYLGAAIFITIFWLWWFSQPPPPIPEKYRVPTSEIHNLITPVMANPFGIVKVTPTAP